MCVCVCVRVCVCACVCERVCICVCVCVCVSETAEGNERQNCLALSFIIFHVYRSAHTISNYSAEPVTIFLPIELMSYI